MRDNKKRDYPPGGSVSSFQVRPDATRQYVDRTTANAADYSLIFCYSMTKTGS